MNGVQLHDKRLLLSLLHPQPKIPGVFPSFLPSTHFSVALMVLERTQSSFLMLAYEGKLVGKIWQGSFSVRKKRSNSGLTSPSQSRTETEQLVFKPVIS